MGPGRDDVWNEKGIVEKFPEGGPKVLWRAKIGLGYAGPAVAGGRVYLMDYRTSDNAAGNPIMRNKLMGRERVVCFDASTGHLLWKHEYDCPYHISYPGGPRCTPTVQGGKVYTLGAMGDLICLDCANGKVL